MSSTLGITLDPVVVNPEIVSKRASNTLDSDPLIRKGSIPTRDQAIQVRPVDTKPSFECMPPSSAFFVLKRAPAAAATRAGITKGSTLS